MATASRAIEATYDVPIIAHAPMEPLNAIANVQADRVDVWVGTQNADMALTLAAQASGVKPENVYIHTTSPAGASAGRRGLTRGPRRVRAPKACARRGKRVWSRRRENPQS